MTRARVSIGGADMVSPAFSPAGIEAGDAIISALTGAAPANAGLHQELLRWDK